MTGKVKDMAMQKAEGINEALYQMAKHQISMQELHDTARLAWGSVAPLGKVIIEVLGGVATVKSVSEGVEVDIIDYDNKAGE